MTSGIDEVLEEEAVDDDVEVDVDEEVEDVEVSTIIGDQQVTIRSAAMSV